MKRLLVGGVFFVGVLARAWMAEASFSSSMSPTDFEAAGLRKLNAAQLARLNALVEAYKNGAMPGAEPRAAATSNVPVAEPVATVASASKPKPEPAPSRPGLIAQARNLLKSSPHDEPPPLASSIVGSFQGWKPKQIFTLASGERVQIANNESYYTPLIENPKVQLSRASLAGYWLRFPDLNVQVRVNLLTPP